MDSQSYIGLEIGWVWRRLGAEVTMAREAQAIFEKQGFRFQLGSRVTAARVEGQECVVEREGLDPLRADRVLLAVGRVPNSENLGLDSAGLQLDA